jgi:hypothetical protein
MTSGDRKMRRVQRQCGKKIINVQNGMNSRLLSEKIASTAYRSRVRRAKYHRGRDHAGGGEERQKCPERQGVR